MLKTIGLRLLSAIPALLVDLFGLAGVASISYGCWMIYEPAGYIAAGTLLLAGVVLISRKST